MSRKDVYKRQAHEIQNPLNFVINFSKLSGQLLADLADRVDEAKARIPEAELEDIKDCLLYTSRCV